MTTSPEAHTNEKNSYGIPLLLALIVAGLAGNYFKYPIFLNIDFLFGSIFAMLALQFFGVRWGIAAVAVSAGYTYLLWNHPYAIIIMTAEVAVVGWLMTRRKIGMVLADTLYWLVIGMPLVYLFYHLVMHVPPSNTYFTMTKQAMNGIANALVARLIFTGYALRSREFSVSYREIVYNLLSFFVLFPALILVAVNSRTDFMETDGDIRSSLTQASHRLDHFVDIWVLNRQRAVVNLAEMSVTRSPQQMQAHLEQVQRADSNFVRVGVLDKNATTTAYYPLVDELGHNNIGKNFADRPFIPHLKQTLKPLLSEVVIGKIGTPKPIVSMLAPVISRGEYAGYTIGVLDLDQIRSQLDSNLAENGTFYSLLDKNGMIILTNRADQKQMSPLVRGEGLLTRLDNNISQWLPKLPSNIPISERWKRSLYVTEAEVGEFAEWKLVLEQPVAPFQKKLYGKYTGKLTLLFLLLLGALALAELLSRRFVTSLEQLGKLTRDLPAKLATQDRDVVWPESGILEASHLINNFREMAAVLSKQFTEVSQINDFLEAVVEARTSELKKSESKFRSLATYVPVGIYQTDADGNCVYVNEKWCELTGLTEAGAMGSGWTHALHPEDRDDVFVEWNASVAEHRPFVLEYRFKTPEGTVHWVAGVASALESVPGVISGYLGTVTDITERKRFEEELRSSYLRFKTILEASPVPQALNDSRMNILYVNPAFIKTFGYALDEIPTLQEWWQLAYPEPGYRQYVMDTWSEKLQKNKSTGTVFEPLEVMINCKDGSHRTVIASAAPLEEYNSDEHLVILFDITHRIQIENTLKETKKFLKSVIEQSPINMWVSDDKGTLVRANQALRDQLNVTDDEIVGVYNIFDDPIVAAQGYMPQVRDVFEKGLATRFVLTYDTSNLSNLQLKNSACSTLDVTISPVVNSAGKVTNAIIQHLDISELKHLEENLRNAKLIAESANKAKSEFLANMSHEIRTPMNGVLGMTQLLEMTGLTEEQQEYTAALKTSGANLMSLINDILDLSKIEAGKVEIELSGFSLRQCIKHIVLMEKAAFSGKGLKLDVAVAEDIPNALIGDQLHIKQVLLNLLGNAAKFTEQGGATLSAHILEQHDTSILIQIVVRDSGIGIAPGALEAIFNPFTQEDGSTSRRFGGSGLGLTICRRLVELMGGSVAVESKQGVGSCFTVTLPFAIDTTVPVIPSSIAHTTDVWDLPPLRVLFVEDDRINITFGSLLLKRVGLDVTVAENGRECLTALENGLFDLVLMDIQMPVMNGEEALQEIRRKEADSESHLPVIAVTAHSMRGDNEHFRTEGFDGYVSKPLVTGVLLQEIKRVIGMVNQHKGG